MSKKPGTYHVVGFSPEGERIQIDSYSSKPEAERRQGECMAMAPSWSFEVEPEREPKVRPNRRYFGAYGRKDVREACGEAVDAVGIFAGRMR